LAHLDADLQGFLEIVVRHCYRVPDVEPATVIDGGANIGFFTLAAVSRWPRADVISVEPHPENADMLARALSTNGLRAEIVPAALAAKSGRTRFHVRDANRGSIGTAEGPEERAIDVAAMRLSDLYARARQPCLIKLDIEGAEVEVLEEFLSVPRPGVTFVGELHRWPENKARFEAALRGFKVDYYDRDPVCVLFTATASDRS
jgi:FkbM family methyltransferase